MHLRTRRPAPLPLMVLLSAFLGISVAPAGGQATPASTSVPASPAWAGPIIDVHLHSYTPEDYWGSAPNPATGAMSPASAEEHMERTLEVMHRHHVVLAIVSGESKSSADRWREKDPERILRGIIMEEPANLPPAETLGEWARSGELDALGEVGAQYAGYSPSDPAYAPYWAVAQELGLPVGIHTGQSFPGTPYGCCPNFRLRLGDPYLLEDMLVEFPRLRVYMMHAGGGGPFQQHALLMMAMYPQLYTDIGVLTWLPGMGDVLESFLRQAQQRGVLDRVLFGTDQMVWPDAIPTAIARIASMDFLSDEEKAGIFYHNAARFLGLSEEEIARHHRMVGASQP